MILVNTINGSTAHIRAMKLSGIEKSNLTQYAATHEKDSSKTSQNRTIAKLRFNNERAFNMPDLFMCFLC
jgi:hypothetical protein